MSTVLQVENINVYYGSNHALHDTSLQFHKGEITALIGPSGCGKTTMLNIIGGLDQYTEGDLIINGRSTKDFKDRDWDTYRNHSICLLYTSPSPRDTR